MRLIGNQSGSGRTVRARPAIEPAEVNVVTVGDLLRVLQAADGLATGAEVVDGLGRPVVGVEWVSGAGGFRQWVSFAAVDVEVGS